MPKFKHLTHFSLRSNGGDSGSTHAFISQTRETLRALAVKNICWHFPADALSVRQLTQLEFSGHLSTDMFTEILPNGHQLESLMLSGPLECSPSTLFRQYRTSLPFLRHFSLDIKSLHRQILDRDLCPAISEFLRPRTQLRTYHLFIPCGEHRRIGFDASAWGVLPALANLRSLSMTYPSDLSSALAGWLVPRSVQALTLELSAITMDATSFFKVNHPSLGYSCSCDLTLLQQIRPGVPPSLKYIGLMLSAPIRSVTSVIEHGFPQAHVVKIGSNMWSVSRTEEGLIHVEQWPYRRVRYQAPEWLELMQCSDAVWKGVHGV